MNCILAPTWLCLVGIKNITFVCACSAKTDKYVTKRALLTKKT